MTRIGPDLDRELELDVGSRLPGEAEPVEEVDAEPRRWHPRRLWQPGRRFALVVLTVMVLAAAVGPLFATGRSEVEVTNRLEPPVGFGGTWEHPLGTDGLGRGVLEGLLEGARASLVVGVGATALAALVGITLGAIAGYRGGLFDTVLGWCFDFQLAFPGLLVILLIAGFVDSGLVPLIFTLAIVSWIVFAQMARSLAMSLRSSEFVAAARLAGTSTPRILRRHLLPNMTGPLVTVALLEVARLMLAESGLSYLGFGVQPPDTSWGLQIAEGQQYLQVAWWVVIFPGLALMAAVFVFNLLSRSTRPSGAGSSLYRVPVRERGARRDESS